MSASPAAFLLILSLLMFHNLARKMGPIFPSPLVSNTDNMQFSQGFFSTFPFSYLALFWLIPVWWTSFALRLVYMLLVNSGYLQLTPLLFELPQWFSLSEPNLTGFHTWICVFICTHICVKYVWNLHISSDTDNVRYVNTSCQWFKQASLFCNQWYLLNLSLIHLILYWGTHKWSRNTDSGKIDIYK